MGILFQVGQIQRIWPAVIGLFCALSATSSHAQQVIEETAQDFQARQGYCSKTGVDIQEQLDTDMASRLSFNNWAGSLGTGLCWWHSRFQRAAQALILFRPDQLLADRAEARLLHEALDRQTRGGKLSAVERSRLKFWSDLIDSIIEHRVTEVPGYGTLYEFSYDFDFLMKKRLEAWQTRDALLRFSWLGGVALSTKKSALRMKITFEQIHHQMVILHRVAVLRFAFPKIGVFGGHSWVVTKMEPLSNGYRIWVIDSGSSLHSVPLDYHFGDDSDAFVARAQRTKAGANVNPDYPELRIGVPDLEWAEDSGRIERSRAEFCRPYLKRGP